MLMLLKSKKGVSPLIATILLIAFAVALGSVVMNWGFTLTISKSAEICNSVEIKIRNIDGSEICFGGFAQNGYVNFIVDNTGATDINGLAIWIVGDKGTKLSDIDNIFLKKGSLYDKKDKEVSYDFTKYGNIKQIQLIPKIKSEEVLKPCPNKAVTAEKVGVCS